MSVAGVAPRMLTRRDVWVGMLLYPAHTLPTAAGPVLVAVGLALNAGTFVPWAAAAAFAAGWLVQLGGVFTDNYQNLARHPDDEEHADFVQAVRTGLISLAEIRRAIYACYAGAIVIGLTLLPHGGLPLLVIGAAAILGSLAYSAGPFPLGDRALGDPLFFLFFGPVSVMGAYFAQAAVSTGAAFPMLPPPGTLTVEALVAGLAFGALITAILVIDNIRDLEYDRSKNEWTIAVLIGPRWSRVEFVALYAFAYAVPAWFAARGWGLAVLLPWLTLPLAIAVARRVVRAPDRASMMPLTPQAGMVMLGFAILMAAGFSRGGA
jgi:1,4-dihydroxy-2-naphthoate octaprenyltransferase